MYADYWTIAWVLILLSCDVSFYCYYILVIVIIAVKTMLPQSWFHSFKLLSLLIFCSCVCFCCCPRNSQTHENQSSLSSRNPHHNSEFPQGYIFTIHLRLPQFPHWKLELLFTRNFLSPPASTGEFLASVKLASSFSLQFVGCQWSVRVMCVYTHFNVDMPLN